MVRKRYSIGSKNLQNQQEKFWFKTSTLIEISVDKQGLYLFPIVLLNALILMGRNDLLVSLFPRICENAWQLSTSADTPGSPLFMVDVGKSSRTLVTNAWSSQPQSPCADIIPVASHIQHSTGTQSHRASPSTD